MLRLRQRGDTIVEVLIVLAILGMALGISYATANRSLRGARQAQEHTEALGLVQGQIEQLRAYAASNPHSDYFSNGTHLNGFCLKDSAPADLNANNLDDLQGSTTYPDLCIAGSGDLYHLSIIKLQDSPDTQTFTFTAKWEDAQGSGLDTVSLTYRIHP